MAMINDFNEYLEGWRKEMGAGEGGGGGTRVERRDS